MLEKLQNHFTEASKAAQVINVTILDDLTKKVDAIRHKIVNSDADATMRPTIDSLKSRVALLKASLKPFLAPLKAFPCDSAEQEPIKALQEHLKKAAEVFEQECKPILDSVLNILSELERSLEKSELKYQAKLICTVK